MKKDVSYYPLRLAGRQRQRHPCNGWCKTVYEDKALSVFDPMHLFLPLFLVRLTNGNHLQRYGLAKDKRPKCSPVRCERNP